MAIRIAGVTLPPKKQIAYALRAIYGIGPTVSKRILAHAEIDGAVRTEDLTDDQISKLRSSVESSNMLIEGDLRREIVSTIRRLKEIGSYRGSRHAKKLPVRGQRTKTNSRTIRGNVRRTMGSGRKPPAQKT